MKSAWLIQLLLSCLGINDGFSNLGEDDGFRIVVGNPSRSPISDVYLRSHLVPSDSLTYIEMEPHEVSIGKNTNCIQTWSFKKV